MKGATEWHPSYMLVTTPMYSSDGHCETQCEKSLIPTIAYHPNPYNFQGTQEIFYFKMTVACAAKGLLQTITPMAYP